MSLKLGVYKHYKGGKYLVLGLAKDSDTLKDMVVYVSLYENKVSKMWVRSLADFEGEVECGGKKFKRFVFESNQ